MTEVEFNQELTYQVTMLYATNLLNDEQITVEQYDKFQSTMLEMYQPIFSKYMDETLDK